MSLFQLVAILFQLTPSRRATSLQLESSALPEYFNSRPHGGRRLIYNFFLNHFPFQLTPSRRATKLPNCYHLEYYISTHALTEGDFRAFILDD